MRKVTAGLFVSLDGVVESPDRWQFDHFDEDMERELAALIGGVDAVLLGRVTYEEWAPYWPTSTDEPFASFINSTAKYVVSTTLTPDDLRWQGSRLLQGDLAGALTALKEQPGGDISVAGSPTLVRSLLRQDLLDGLTLMVHPVVAGEGKRLFEGGGDVQRLRLADSRATRTGVAILRYEPRRD